MSRGAKLLVAALVVTGLFWIGVAAAVAWTVHAVATSPPIEISVREHGGAKGHVSLRLPAALVVGGAMLAPRGAHDAIRAEIGGEIDLARWGPAAAELAHQLDTMPDATLVDVRDGGDRVLIVKRGADLTVRVRSPDGDVDVTLPASLAGDVVGRLTAAP